jgi:hypothetical protein
MRGSAISGLDEAVLRMGPAGNGPAVLFVPPLFDEANRMRRTLALTMRALAARGTPSLLPDLPGQNDSMVPTEAADLDLWRAALAARVAAEARPLLIASIRGGTLIDSISGPIGWWRLAPVTGASLLRTLLRTQVASDRESGKASSTDSLLADAQTGPITLAGNRLSRAMIAQLQSAQPAPAEPLFTASLGSGDGAIAGSTLWLRAEPGEDAAMAAAMAASIHDWMNQCAAR